MTSTTSTIKHQTSNHGTKLAQIPPTAHVNYAKPAKGGGGNTALFRCQPHQSSLSVGIPPLSAFEFPKLIDPPNVVPSTLGNIRHDSIHSYTSLIRLSLNYNRRRRFTYQYTVDGRRNSATNRRLIWYQHVLLLLDPEPWLGRKYHIINNNTHDVLVP